MSELWRAMKIILIALFLLGLLVGLCALMHVFGLVLFCIAAFTILLAITRRWANRKRSLLWALAAAAERNMPLAPVVEAHGRENGYSADRQARAMASLLNSGHSLSVASRSVRGLLPRYAIAPIRLGEQSGDLAAGLRLAARGDRASSPVWFSLAGKTLYILGCILFFAMILAFVCLKIVPAYECIFDDFELELPAVTLALVDWSVSMYSVGAFVFGPLFLLVGFIVVCILLWCFGAVHGTPPGARRLLGRFASADIMDALALSVDRNRPAGESIQVLSESYPDAWVRGRLARALIEIEGGRNWTEALRDRKILNASDLQVLHAATQNNNLAWALRQRAEAARRRLERRLYSMLQVTFPAVIMAFGVVVGVFAIGMFLPLVTLIESLI